MAVTAAAPSRRRLSPNVIWSIGFVVVAVASFVFYNNVLGQLQDSAVAGVQRWANLSSLCECLVYAIMARGLNIVVGYAGLLDLGYVALWAIGSYVGAYLMSAFIFQLE